jgi:CheY-like chemotaxis protein
MQLPHPYFMLLPAPDLMPDRPPLVILVVDDEVLIRSVIAEYLRECGFHVFEAADGSEAREILQGAGMPIDLVFSDVQMPKLDGFELARWIRENRPEVQVLLTSGNPGMAAAKATELCHKGPIVPKPYDHAILLNRMKRMLTRGAEMSGG